MTQNKVRKKAAVASAAARKKFVKSWSDKGEAEVRFLLIAFIPWFEFFCQLTSALQRCRERRHGPWRLPSKIPMTDALNGGDMGSIPPNGIRS